jgi:hypothetical protein
MALFVPIILLVADTASEEICVGYISTAHAQKQKQELRATNETNFQQTIKLSRILNNYK